LLGCPEGQPVWITWEACVCVCVWVGGWWEPARAAQHRSHQPTHHTRAQPFLSLLIVARTYYTPGCRSVGWAQPCSICRWQAVAAGRQTGVPQPGIHHLFWASITSCHSTDAHLNSGMLPSASDAGMPASFGEIWYGVRQHRHLGMPCTCMDSSLPLASAERPLSTLSSHLL